jgi:hypothetical protein
MKSSASDPVPNAAAPPWSLLPATPFPTSATPDLATLFPAPPPHHGVRRCRQGRGRQHLGVLRCPSPLHQSKIELSSLSKNRTRTLNHSKIEVSRGWCCSDGRIVQFQFVHAAQPPSMVAVMTARRQLAAFHPLPADLTLQALTGG